MSTLEAAFEHLPQPILDKLQSMIRRVRRLLFIRGLFATLAVALACLLAIMAIDATLTLFSNGTRWALSLAGLGLTGIAAWWFLVRPLSRKFTLTRMARILEIRHPELQERISTAVELLSSNDPDSIKGSEELISEVVDSAVNDVGTVDPKAEFQTKKGRKFIFSAAVIAGVILLTLLIWPRQSWTLLTRAVAPFLDIGNAYAETLVIDPGNIRIASGDSLTINMTVKHKRLRRAEIRRLLPDGTDSVERMALVGEDRDGTKRFSLTFPSIEKNFQYRIRAGAALSRYYEVEAIDPPAIEGLKIRYEYPEYTSRTPDEVETETGEIRAVAHTRVKVTATVNKEVHTSKLILNEATDLGSPEVDGNRLTWETELLSGMNGSWHLELSDVNSFTNHPVSYPLEVLPDKSPIVQITRPALRELRLRPTERLVIESDIVEDFGFGDAAFLITPDEATLPLIQEQELPHPTSQPQQFKSRNTLDLATIKLKGNQHRIAVQLQIRDNRPSDYDGPGVGLSDPIFITIDSRAKSLAQQAIETQKKEISDHLQEAKRELERARDEMRRVEQEMQKSDEVNDRIRRELDDFSERTEAARENLDEVVATLNQTLFQEQANQAANISNKTIREAHEKADLIPVTDDKQERLYQARQSRRKVEEAIREVEAVSEAMKEADDEYRMISELNDLASKQQELAMNAEEWARREEEITEAQDAAKQRAAEQQQRQEMNAFQAQQGKVQQQLGQMLKDNAAALDEVLEAQQEQAEAMAGEAAKLAAEQETLKEISEAATKASSEQQEKLKEALVDTLRERQEELAGSAREMAGVEEAIESSESEALMKGAEKGFETAKNLEGDQLNEAAESAAAASEQLAGPAPSEGDEGEPSPKRNELTRKQEAITGQIEAVKNGDLQEALSLLEAQLNTEAAQLGEAAGAFETAMDNLSQENAGKSADQAQQALKQGAQKAQQSSKQLSRAQAQQSRAESNNQVQEGELSNASKSAMQQSQAEQNKAANLLNQAAKALGQSAESIGKTMEGLEPSDADNSIADSSELAEGFEEVSESSQSQNAQEAAEQSREAANTLQQLAQSAMQKLGNPGQAQPTPPGEGEAEMPPSLTGEPDSDNLNESGEKGTDINGDGIPPELEKMGISLEDWTRFRGALVGGNATAIETELPTEYRELVGRYFQVIAKEAGKKP
ncbi:MAG: hypothetical protein P1U68_11485 [Verrucomicrobiales bacterium]|nr:hypothetical protein [Verrucomicrobiales bacterium]